MQETRICSFFIELLDSELMWHGVDGFSPSSWGPQEEGMMRTAASFSLSKKPRFNRIQEKAKL
jgi:hypothetical protein